jgi:hypothetical protein
MKKREKVGSDRWETDAGATYLLMDSSVELVLPMQWCPVPERPFNGTPPVVKIEIWKAYSQSPIIGFARRKTELKGRFRSEFPDCLRETTAAAPSSKDNILQRIGLAILTGHACARALGLNCSPNFFLASKGSFIIFFL